MKDVYLQHKQDELWLIKESEWVRSLQAIRESQFALGNGFMGTRGVLEEIPYDATPGTYFSGIYDAMISQVSELVNFPNPFHFKLTVNGEKLGVIAMNILDHQRILNTRQGVLLRKTTYLDTKKNRYDYQSMRFVSMDNKNIGMMQIVLTSLDCDAEIELHTGIDTSVYNKGAITEGRKKHFRIKELGQQNSAGYLILQNFAKTHHIIYRSGFYYVHKGKKTYASDNILTLKLKKGKPVVFTKVFYANVIGLDANELKKEIKLSRNRFKNAFHSRYTHLVNKHKAAWRKLWNVADIEIRGTSDIQKNVRFNIYHMLICANNDNGFSSVGARTLSGEGYRGHVFWDAEIFNLPFYAFVFPDLAKNMLLYRYQRLDKAKEIAKKNGFKGALFPWESAETGCDETPGWAKNIDGKVIKISTGKYEHHISADIAHAVYYYYLITKDEIFMKRCGYELLLETARFWSSRLEKKGKNQYVIKNVIGPDEFHDHVDNNAYTNMLARWNMHIAQRAWQELKKDDPAFHKKLSDKLRIGPKEVQLWKTQSSRIKINIRQDKVIEQFDGFFKKRHIEIINFDENAMPLLPEGVRVKDYNKTQLVKQADVLMLLYLLSDEFNRKTKESNFWYYESRTLHQSSLSPAAHALMALEVGALSKAYQFFNVALRADISNLHGNTDEGVHAASLGGVWQMVVNGFAGIKVNKKKAMLSVNPFMPRGWHGIHCSLFWHNKLLRFKIENSKVSIKVESNKKITLRIMVFGQTHTITSRKKTVFTRKRIDPKKEIYYL